MANAMGLTKYGFKIEFLANGATTTKSYNWVNFQGDAPAQKGGLLEQFFKGDEGSNNGLYDVVNAMGSPYSINGQSITQENAVTFT